MKYIFSILAFLFIFSTNVFSQELENIQGFKIGVTPSALLNKWLGYQGKVAYMHKRFEFEANVGYLAGRNNGESYSGIRIRPLVKYYFAQTPNEFYYFGFGGLYRSVDVDATGVFGRYDTSYFQSLDFKLKEKMKGLYFMFGVLMPLRGDHFFVDLGAGLGNSKLKIEHFDVPDDALFYTTFPFFSTDTRSPGTQNYLILFGHCSFMYMF